MQGFIQVCYDAVSLIHLVLGKMFKYIMKTYWRPLLLGPIFFLLFCIE